MAIQSLRGHANRTYSALQAGLYEQFSTLWIASKSKENRSLMKNPYEAEEVEELAGGGRSPLRTRLRAEFPANRQNNREICKFGSEFR